MLEGRVLGTVSHYGVQAHTLDQTLGLIVNAVQDLGFGWTKQQVQWKRDLNFSVIQPDSLKAMWSIVGADWETGETFSVLGYTAPCSGVY